MPAQILLNDRLLRSWLRCKRRAWLDRHGDSSLRLWTAHRELQLDEQRRSFSSLFPQRPGHGEAAAAAGAPAVVGLRLKGPEVEAHPPLLQRIQGSSRWGEHAYRPVIFRQGRRTTREHRVVLALWGRLLADEQQAPVRHGLVLSGAGRGLQQETLALGGSLPAQLDEALRRLSEDLDRSSPPPLVADRKKCVLCSWKACCDVAAAQEGHLSEVSGIGAKRRDMLLELGITRLEALAEAQPQALAEALLSYGEQHAEIAGQLVTQAQVQHRGQPLRRDSEPSLPELAAAPGVLIYDIESDPDARDDFLHGFVRLPRNSDGSWPDRLSAAVAQAPYHPMLALWEHGEERLWQRLQRLLAAYPDWPVLHYGETELLALVRLAQRQGAKEKEIQALRARMLDVHQRLRRHWWMPTNSYGLKAVASWLGFAWRQKGVDGARALLWWRRWRLGGEGPAGRGPRQNLRRIFRYNHDDALATWAVAAWLLQQDQPDL
ncbi:MAG: TM0106 family RecB-like putative nuclease [Vulcanococcus sp.]